jgi:hypothetical protein
MEADNFIDTASPPGSSIGLESFLPLAKRSKDVCSFALFCARYDPARKAAVLVDMFIDIFGISYGCLPVGILADRIVRETGYERNDSCL